MPGTNDEMEASMFLEENFPISGMIKWKWPFKGEQIRTKLNAPFLFF